VQFPESGLIKGIAQKINEKSEVLEKNRKIHQ